MWTEILKSLPRDRSGLIEMLKDDVAFRRLIRTLGRRELRGNHFIKDFKDLMGLSPKEFLNSEQMALSSLFYK